MTVHLVFKSSEFWGRTLAGVFATRGLAERFVETRKTPASFWVVSHQVFEDLQGCEFFRTPKE